VRRNLGALPRRDFVLDLARAAGVTPLMLGVLGGRAQAMPRDEGTELAILNCALALEHQAVAVYDFGLEEGLFARNLRSYADEFRGDHVGHRDTQISIVEERGGHAVSPLHHYEFGRLRGGDTVLRAALSIEIAAQRAYSTLISEIQTKDYLLSAAFILVDEVRHETIWRRALGLKIY